jgi:hypothetical protein
VRHPAAPRRIGWVIQGTGYWLTAVEQLDDLLLVPDVVTGRDDVDPCLEQLPRRLVRQAPTAGDVLAVGDDDIRGPGVAR